MGRFSIARVMLLVGLVGVNFAAIRVLLAPSTRPEPPGEMLMGLIPLANALLVSLYFAASRYRCRMVARRTAGLARRGIFVLSFALACGFLLVVLMGLFLWDISLMEGVFLWAGPPAERVLNSVGVDTSSDTLMLRCVILPGLLCLLFSGPALVVASVVAWTVSRFQVLITPRGEGSDEGASFL